MGFGSGGGGFTPSPNNVPGSTTTGTDKDTDVHEFTGSVDITGSLLINGVQITQNGGGGGGGSPGGANTQVQFNDNGSFGGSANFTFDGNTITVSDDADIVTTLGKAKIGYNGTSDYANFAHRDQMSSNSFALQQRANGETIVNAKSGESLSLRMGGTNALVVAGASNNNVGINTGSPAARLHVSASSVEKDVLRVDGVTDAGVTIENVLYVSGSGRVGIGTGDPSNNLHIQSVAAASIYIEADTDNTPETDTGFLKITQDGGNSKFILGINGNAGTDPEVTYLANGMSNAGLLGTRTSGMPMQFTTGNRSKLCIQPDGQVGIGESFDESDRPSALLHVSGTTTAQGTAATSPLLKVEHDDNANILFVTGSGHVGINSASPAQTLSISGSISYSGSFGASAIQNLNVASSPVLGSGKLVNAVDGNTVIDITGLANNAFYSYGISDGTFAGQQKNIIFKQNNGGTINTANSAEITGSNIDVFGPGLTTGQVVLSGSDPGGGYQGFTRGTAQLIWDGSKWQVLGLINATYNSLP